MSFFHENDWSDRVYAYIVDEPNNAVEYQSVWDWGLLFDEIEDEYGLHLDFLFTDVVLLTYGLTLGHVTPAGKRLMEEAD